MQNPSFPFVFFVFFERSIRMTNKIDESFKLKKWKFPIKKSKKKNILERIDRTEGENERGEKEEEEERSIC